jgi:cyclopropane-fatty-acyl-phospholipid synthase
MTTQLVHAPALDRWPSLAPPRPSPVRRAAALAAIRYMARDLPATIAISGRHYGNAGPELTVHRPGPFLDRLSRDAGTGFGEAFLAGDWDPAPGTDLAELLLPFAERFGADKDSGLLPPWAQTLRGVATRTHPADSDNDRTQAQVNVNRHYGLDNSMFAEFLDNSMTYSCAMFDPDPAEPPPYELQPVEPPSYKDLEPAQLRKLDAVLDAAGVRSGSRVLEIGCGWGSLAIRAAQRGAWVTAITIGNRQAVQAQHRIDDAGVRDRVKIALRDYRDQIGEFDAVLSVEMIEAVGEKYWPVYFGVIERRLAPGGIAVVQAIVMPHERMLATRNTYTWVQKYIFPGGLLPSVRAMEEVNAQHTGLQVEVLRRLGTHYGPTLRLWRERFGERWPQIEELGFDPTFRRMWELYLAYSEAGFRSGYLDDVQIRLTRRT